MSAPLSIPQRKTRSSHLARMELLNDEAGSPSTSLSSETSDNELHIGTSPSSSSSSSLSPSPEKSSDGRSKTWREHERRPSLLSSSLSKSEHTVINVGHPDGPPRLITCVRSSQGFDWNQEIFLPSHTSSHPFLASSNPPLERKRDIVHEIVLSEQELKDLLPQ